jgi:hypothetical protein
VHKRFHRTYSVPWPLAGRDVRVCEIAGHLEVYAGAERIAIHPLCADRHQVLTQRQHHQGIPLHLAGRPVSDKITIQVRPPDVEVRPLAVYAAVADGGESE